MGRYFCNSWYLSDDQREDATSVSKRHGHNNPLPAELDRLFGSRALSLWWKKGTVYIELPATLSNSEGQIQISGADDLAIASYVPGQALDLAIVSKSTDRRAHAKMIPFPVQAQGDGGCSASAEIATKSGLLFVFSLRGFQPGEEVQTTNRYKGETILIPSKASERGEILGLPGLFERGSSGKATLTAKGRNCTVSLDYNIGKDAIVVQ